MFMSDVSQKTVHHETGIFQQCPESLVPFLATQNITHAMDSADV